MNGSVGQSASLFSEKTIRRGIAFIGIALGAASILMGLWAGGVFGTPLAGRALDIGYLAFNSALFGVGSLVAIGAALSPWEENQALGRQPVQQ